MAATTATATAAGLNLFDPMARVFSPVSMDGICSDA
jgi:hypothetical protein